MLDHLILLTETLATVMCLHCLHGEKPKSIIRTVGLILSILIVLEIVNYYGLNDFWTCFGYVSLLIYCKKEFGNTIIRTLITFLAFVVVFIFTQFICMNIVSIFVPNNLKLQNVIGNIVILGVSGGIIPRVGIEVFTKSINVKTRISVPLMCYMLFIVLLLIVQIKLFRGIQVGIFIFVVPALVLVILLLIKWYKSLMIAENMEKELRLVNETTATYNDLLTKVRMRQHDFKNMLTAVYSSHYTCKTYEQLVKTQEKYCEKLLDENKYNSLLLIGEPVLSAFLYMKFQEADEDNITVTYNIATKIENCKVETYYLIEMLGILLDNAMEALKDYDDKRIYLQISTMENEYEFLIRNRYEYVCFSDIKRWFALGDSPKGEDRGLGLPHLKYLCNKLGCSIVCQSIKIDEEYWIQFTLNVNKAENA